MRTSHPQGLRDASSFAGSLLLGPFQQHAAANEARKRRRGSYQEPRAMLSAPVRSLPAEYFKVQGHHAFVAWFLFHLYRAMNP